MTEIPVAYAGEIIEYVPPKSVAEPRPEDEPGRCYYCGDIASTVDHVVPQSMLRTLRDLGDEAVTAVLVRFGRRLTVPACRECNLVLSNSYQDTLAKRKAECKKRLRRRYKKLLRMPDWTDTELARLDGWMQDYVIRSLVHRDIIRRRLAY